MEDINHALFLWLNAPEQPSPFLLAIATLFAKYVIWTIPALVGFGWLRGSECNRRRLLEATGAGLVALLISHIIGWAWPQPRPFMIGIGHTFMAHAPDASFPSDHLTLLWSVAFSLLRHPAWRIAGWVVTLLGVPVAWARIYLGVHFPLDIVGAAMVAVLGAVLAHRAEPLYLSTAYRLAHNAHHIVFGKLIEMGWVRK